MDFHFVATYGFWEGFYKVALLKGIFIHFSPREWRLLRRLLRNIPYLSEHRCNWGSRMSVFIADVYTCVYTVCNYQNTLFN